MNTTLVFLVGAMLGGGAVGLVCSGNPPDGPTTGLIGGMLFAALIVAFGVGVLSLAGAMTP